MASAREIWPPCVLGLLCGAGAGRLTITGLLSGLRGTTMAPGGAIGTAGDRPAALAARSSAAGETDRAGSAASCGLRASAPNAAPIDTLLTRMAEIASDLFEKWLFVVMLAVRARAVPREI